MSVPDDPTKLSLFQFDYSWKWFAYHADQRVKMFNYMLLAMGIIANAGVNAVNDGMPIAAVVMCGIGVFFALAFFFLDWRNRCLVNLGEDVLRELEKTAIFGANNTITTVGGEDVRYGVLSRQDVRQASVGIGRRTLESAWRGKHRFWMPAIAICLGVGYFAAGAKIYSTRDALTSRSKPPISQPHTAENNTP